MREGVAPSDSSQCSEKRRWARRRRRRHLPRGAPSQALPTNSIPPSQELGRSSNTDGASPHALHLFYAVNRPTRSGREP